MEGLVRLLRGYQFGDMPGVVNCPGTDPLGGGIGGDTAAILLGLKLYNSFPFLHQYITLIAGSHHLISQAGWNRCNLSIYLIHLSSATGLIQVLPGHPLADPRVHTNKSC